jgi:hypothetical protein
MFQQSVDAVLGSAEKVSEDKRYKQLKDGKAHALWFMGHIANTNSLIILRWCCELDPTMPKEFIKKFAPDFGGGETPTSDPSNYPTWDETLDIFRKTSEACVSGIRNLTDEELDGPIRGGAPESMVTQFGSVAKTIGSMIMHSEYHRGQMNLINAL